MINHFHIQAHNHKNTTDDDNLLTVSHNMVTTTPLQNYKNLNNNIEKGNVQRLIFEGKIP